MKKIFALFTLALASTLAAQNAPVEKSSPALAEPSKAYGEFLAKVTPPVLFTAQPGAFAISDEKKTPSICVADDEWLGVKRAAADLASDIGEVTGRKPALSCTGSELMIIGSLGHSSIIDQVIAHQHLDVAAIRGQWEATKSFVVDKPLPGVARALVIVGSDKRGAIYGAYDLSAAIGQSPWHWWADAPTQKHTALYLAQGWLSPAPAVQYRGVFLNDEAPALTNWSKEKFGGYNSKLYTHVFELILRLHANFLWPAMWDAAFNEDDPLNPKLADEYGVVMSTSHHEPMLRAQQEWKRHGSGEWNYEKNGEFLRKFWADGVKRNGRYESVITLGMRGDGDLPMSEGENVALLEKIVADQRKILADNATPELDRAPKVWALYKEVQGYYERGMRVPDDVTLLWCDDNWGDIRRLPTPEERKRKGGAGVYYHFDYVGGPRNYKWINTNNLPKTWEQMNLALRYDARRIWIVNVGDLKPMEQPISFFLDLARAGEALTYADLKPWGERWAAQQFGREDAAKISSLLFDFGRLIGRRKPELTDPSTWSVTRDHEAERVADEWRDLQNKAMRLGGRLPEAAHAAYFELVEHPISAASVVNRLHIAAANANLWAYQGRAAANDEADRARALFVQDTSLANDYHSLLNGKWNHMMDQTHIGYTYWNQPPLNTMPPISGVQPLAWRQMGLAVEGSERSLTNGEFSHHVLPGVDSINQQTRTVTLFNVGARSTAPIAWRASSDLDAVTISPDKDAFSDQQLLTVSVDWSKAPAGRSTAHLRFDSADGHARYTVDLPLLKPADLTRDNLSGSFESFGQVAVEANHFTAKHDAAERWVELPGYGETLSAMTINPVDFAGGVDANASAALDYKMYFTDAGSFVADFVIAPTLNFVPGRGLRFAVQIDGGAPTLVDALAHNTEADWNRAVSDGVRHVYLSIDVASVGYHTLTLRVVDPALVLERIVLRQADKNGRTEPASLLGPAESARGAAAI